MWYFVYATIVIVFDQASKYVITRKLSLHESWPVIGDFFQITSHRNKGAAFGILQNQRWFFVVITIIVIALLIWYLRKTILEGKRLLPFALSLLLGGAAGNFIDRLRLGEVIDFLQFNFRFAFFGREIDYTYPIFNVADSAIVVGVALIFLDALLMWRKERKGLHFHGDGA